MDKEVNGTGSNLKSSVLRIKKLRLVIGFFVMSFMIEVSAPILFRTVGIAAASGIASILVFGYIFGAILYVEWLRSEGKGFWKGRGVITVLVWTLLYVIGMITVFVSGGL